MKVHHPVNFARASALACGLVRLVCLVLGTFAFALGARATQVVYVRADAVIGGDGTTWANAYSSLATAITSVNQHPGAPVEIWIKNGVYTPTPTGNRAIAFEPRSDVTLRGGFLGNETSYLNRPAPATATAFTVLSGDIGVLQADTVTASTNVNALAGVSFAVTANGALDNSYNVVRLTNVSGITLDQIVIAGGYANSSAVSETQIEGMLTPISDSGFGFQQDILSGATGGGLYVSKSDLNVLHCWFVGNFAQGLGGGMVMRGGSLTLQDSQFVRNVAGYAGGGLSLQAAGLFPVERNEFYGNTSAFLGGGALIQADTDNTHVKAYEGTALLALGALASGTTSTAAVETDPGTPYAYTKLLKDVRYLSKTVNKMVNNNSGLLDANLAKSPLVLLEEKGAGSAIGAAYGWVAFVEVSFDLGVQLAVLLGVSPDDPFVKAWSDFDTAFNAYATPFGLAKTIYNFFVNLDAPSFEQRAYALRNADYQDNQNHANATSFADNRFDHNYAAGFGGGVVLLRANAFFDRNYFTENAAGNGGGGALALCYNTVGFENTAFIRNRSSLGHSAFLGVFRTENRFYGDSFVGNASSLANGYAVGGDAGADISLINDVLWGNTNGDTTSLSNPNRTGGADLWATRWTDLDAGGRKAYSDAGDSHGLFTAVLEVQYCDIESLSRLTIGTSDFLGGPLPDYLDYDGYNLGDRNPNLGEGIRAPRGNFSKNPMFIQDIFLRIGSPLVDAGSPYTNGRSGANADIASAPRNDGHDDVGAVESKGVLPAGVTLYVNAAVAASGDGFSWATAYKTMGEALAVPLSPNSSIWVAQGTYYPTAGTNRSATLTLGEGVNLIGSLPVGATDITQSNPAFYPTTLSGEIASGSVTDNSYVLLRGVDFFHRFPEDVVPRYIRGFRFTGANSNEAAVHLAVPVTIQNCIFDHNDGARALLIDDPYSYAYHASTSISDCTFDTNSAGAIDYNASQLDLIRCNFFNNTAAMGAAVNQGPSYTINGSLKLERCVIAFNTATAGRGAVRTNVPNLQFAQTDIVYNNATLAAGDTTTRGGAGFYWDANVYQATWVTVNSIFYGNRLTSAFGATLEAQQFGIQIDIPDYFPVWANRIFKANDIEGLQTLAVLNGPDGNVDYDPLFVNSGALNFALKNNSPLINLGTDYSSGTDATATVNGTARDLGAFESTVANSALQPLVLTTPKPTPDGRIFILTLSSAGITTPTSIVWQVRRPGSGAWVPIGADAYTSGLTTSTLTLTNPPVSWSGSLYRLTFVASGGAAYSTTVSLSIQPSILYVKTTKSGIGDGSSWNNAATLGDAINVAAAYTSIWATSGVHTLSRTTNYDSAGVHDIPFAIPAGARIYGGFAGTEGAFSQRSTTAGSTQIRADYDLQLFGITGTATWPVDSSPIPTVLDRVTIAPAAEQAQFQDVFVAESANTVFNNVTFTSPVTDVRVHNGTAVFTGCVFTGGNASVPLDLNAAAVQISNSRFSNNGAGALLLTSATVTLADSIFSANYGTGAIVSAGTGGSLDIQRCQFLGNGSGTNGGALDLPAGTARIANSLFARNTTNGGTGGAIFAQTGALTVLYSTFVANTASNGSAIDAGVASQLTGSIVWDNVATGSGSVAVRGSVTSTTSFVQGVTAYAPGFDPTSAIFALSATSPLLNVGETTTTQSGTLDLSGTNHPRHYLGGAADAGASEYQGAPGTPVYLTVQPANVSVGAEQIATFSIAGNVGSPTGAGSFFWEYQSGPNTWLPVAPATGVPGLSGAVVTPGTNSSTLVFANTNAAMNGLQLRVSAGSAGVVAFATLNVAARPVIYVDRRRNGDGHSWATAFSDLGTALYYAQSGTDIWVAGGDYANFDQPLNAGVHIYLGFTGTETSAAQRNALLNPVRISFGNVYTPLVVTDPTVLPTVAFSGVWLDGVPNSTTAFVGGAASFTAEGYGSAFHPLSWEYFVASSSLWLPISNLPGWTVAQPTRIGTRGLTGEVSTLSNPNVQFSDSGLVVRAVYSFYNMYSYDATLTVLPRPILYVNSAVSVSGNGSSWATAFKTIGAAVAAATASTDIWIAGGDYPLSGLIALAGTRFYVGFAGNETSVDARNQALHPVRVSGAGSYLTVTPDSNAALPAFIPQIITGPVGASPYAAKPVAFTAESSGSSVPTLAWEYFTGSTWASISGLSGWFVTQTGTVSTLANSAVPQSLNGTQFRAVVPGTSESSVVATLTVKPRAIRYVNRAIASAGNGTTWATAFKSISAALAVADFGTDIWIAGGSYPELPLTFVPGANLYGGFVGGETDVATRNLAAHPVLLQGIGSTIDLASAVAGLPYYQLASPPRAAPMLAGQAGRISINRSTWSAAALTWQYLDASQVWQPIASLAGWSVEANSSLSTSSIVNAAVPSAQDGTQIRVSVGGTNEVSFVMTLALAARSPLYVNGAVASSGNGASWATAYKTVNEALAHATSGTDLWIAQGTYDETTHTLPAGAKLYGGFASGDSALTARSLASHPVTLRNSTGHRIWSIDLTGSSTDQVAVIDSVIIDGQTAADAAAYITGGGALFSKVTFSNNGVACSTDGAATVLTFDTCTFTANTTGLLIASGPSVTITGSTFTGGTTAVQAAAGAELLISGSTFTGQTGSSLQIAPGAAIEYSTFTGSSGTSQAIVVNGTGPLSTEIFATTFTNYNPAVRSAAPLAIVGSTFSNCALGLDLLTATTTSTLTNGSFLNNVDGVHSPTGLSVTGTTFTGNQQGLVLSGTSGVSTVTNASFSGHTVAGLIAGGSLTVTGSTFATDAIGIAINGGNLASTIKSTTFTGETSTAITSTLPLTLDTDTFTSCASGVALSSGASTIVNCQFTSTTGIAVSAVAGLTMTGSAISGGTTGLVIVAASPAATSTVSGSTFSALTVAGITSANALTLTNDTFTGCALGARTTLGALQVAGSTFQNGLAGLAVAASTSSPGSLVVTNSLFTANSGVGITVVQPSSGGVNTSVTTTRFLTNSGQLFNQTQADVVFDRCTIYGNSSSGALLTNTGSVTLFNTLVAHNTITTGSALIVTTADAFTDFDKIFSCTIADNNTGTAAGVISSHTPSIIKQSILWGNRSSVTSNSIETMQADSTAIVTQSAIEGLASAFRIQSSQGNTVLNPVFVDQVAGNYALNPVSPAIDAAGTNATGDTLDVAGNARLQSTALDLGAIESPYVRSAQPLLLTFIPSSPSVIAGNSTSLTLGFVVGSTYTIRWQYFDPGTSTWINLVSSATETSSYAGSTLSLVLSPPANDFTLDGRRYRAVIAQNGVDVYASPASTLKVIGASTYYVDAAVVGGTGDGSSWANAYTSLTTALTNAPLSANILVAAGTYVAPSGGLTLKNNQHLQGSYLAGTSIRDFANTPTILSSAVGATATSAILVGTSISSGTLVEGFIFQGVGIGLNLASGSPAVRSCGFVGLANGINDTGGQLVVDSCVFTSNTAGAIRVAGAIGSGLQVSNSTFTANTFAASVSNGGSGGAISLGGSSQAASGGQNLVVSNCTFTGNSANRGGAIGVGNFGSVALITRSTFTGNSAGDSAGALFMQSDVNTSLALAHPMLIVRDSLFAGNHAVRSGAAFESSSPTFLYYVTIAGNSGDTANQSSALDMDDARVLEIHGSILWGNTVGATSDEFAQVRARSVTDVHLFDSILQAEHNYSGTNVLPFDPRFVDAAHGNYQLGPDSPAIGAGQVADLSSDQTDLAGVVRPVGSAPDLGAYESTGAASSPVYTVTLPASVAVYPGTDPIVFPGQNLPPGYTGVWQYNNGGGWVTITEVSQTIWIGPPGTISAAVSLPPFTLDSVLTLQFPGTLLDGTAIRFVLTNSTNAAIVGVSNPEVISILPFQSIYVDGSRPVSGDGTSWATAYRTLAEGLAAITSARRILYVAEGSYPGGIAVPQYVTMLGGFPAGGGDLTDRNPAAHPTILRGLADDGVTRFAQVVNLLSNGAIGQTTFDGFVIENGHTGILVAQNSSPTLSNLIVRGNDNSGLILQGAAIVADSLFENNVGTNGGGIFVNAHSLGTTFDRVIVRGNSATLGGGIYAISNGTPIFRDVLITGNLADTGGAAYGVTPFTFIHATIAGNRARIASAIYTSNLATVSNSIVWGNRATSGDATVQFVKEASTGAIFALDHVVAEQAPLPSSVMTFDPFFVFPVDAANAPTTTGDYRLRVVSAAIDAGSTALASGLTLDVAGQTRVVGPVDLGGYESLFTGVTPLLITSSPSALTFHRNQSNTFTVAGTGIVTVAWQYAAPNGGAWVSLEGVAGFSNIHTTTLSVDAATSALNGYRFRALVTGTDGSVTASNEAVLSTFVTRLYVNNGRAGTDTGDGLSWATSFRSLDTAIAAAPTDSSGTDLWIAAGTYTPTIAFRLRNGLLLYGGFAGTETSLTDRNPALNVTTLMASAVQQANVIQTVTLAGVTLPARLDGLTIRGINTSILTTGVNNSAGCSIDFERVKFTALSTALNSGSGTLNFRHLDVRGNDFGLFVAGGSVLLEDSLFSGNTSLSGVNTFRGPAVVRNSTFTGNRGVQIYFGDPSNQTYNCIFWGNSGAATFDLNGNVGTVSGCVIENYATIQARATSFANNSSVDPQFTAPITPSATPSTAGTFTLATNSLAIDTGVNAQTSSSGFDLAGNPRQAGLFVDPGAYEYQGNDVYVITTQPISAALSATLPTTFTVGASRPATYAWEISFDGVNFTTVDGATTATLTVPAGTGINGYSYRARVQFTTGPQLISNVVQIANTAVTAVAGLAGGFATPAQFSATANGAVTAWQWQVSTNGVDFSPVSGGTNNTLQVLGDASFTQRTYRAQATFADSTTAISNAVAFVYVDAFPIPTSTSAPGFTLSGGVLSTSLTDSSVAVLPQFGGRLSLTGGSLARSISGANVTFTTTRPIAAGSRVFITTTSGLLRADGIGARPQVWEYRVPTVSGPGAFATPTPLSSNAATTVAAGDVDNDGAIDLVVADTAGLRVWRNNGLGVFTANASAFGVAGARAIALGSLRSGAALDAVVVTAAGDVQIWTNDTHGVFTLAQTISALSARAIALGDLDADGDVDLLVATASGNRVYFNGGSGNFTLGSSFDSGVGTSVALGDLDNDGALDAVVTSSLGTTVWANNGRGAFTSVYSTSVPADRVALADLNHDVRLDVIVTIANQPAQLYRNNGTFQFTALANAPGGGTATLAAGDIDGDGIIDLVLTSANGTTAPWLTQSSLASRLAADQPPVNFGAEATLVDLDGDGALDLIGIDASGHAVVSLYRLATTRLDEDTTTTLAAAGFTPTPTQVYLVTLPASGVLLNGAAAVHVGDTFTLAAAAALTYQPNANFSGVDSFTWSATSGGTARTYGMIVRSVADAVVANADAITLAQGATATTLTGGATSVFANDVNPDAGTVLAASVITAPAHGALTLNSDGSFNYVHDNTETRTDSFVYRATNRVSGLFADATVTITITNVNAAPTALTLTAASGTLYTGQAAGLVMGTLSATDVDPEDADLLTFTLVSGTGSTGNADFTIAGTTLKTAGAIDATTGLTRSIRVRATDTLGLFVEQTFTVSFTQAPTAIASTITTDEDTPIAVTLAGAGGVSALTYAITTAPAHGALVLSTTAPAPNAYVYTPAANYHGVDTFAYQVADSALTSAAATVTFTVNSVEDLPVLPVIAPITINEDNSATFTLLGTDGDNDPLTYALTSTPAFGTVHFAGAVVTYTPNANANGIETLSFTVSDGHTTSAPISVVITVTAVNDAPIIAAIAARVVTRNTSDTFTPTLTDAEGDPITLRVGTAPQHGAIVITANSVQYTPTAGFTGTDSYTLIASDGVLDSTPATVAVNVTSIATEPVASLVYRGLYEYTDIPTVSVGDWTGVVPANLSTPAHGTVSFDGSRFLYSHNGDTATSDSFTYTLTNSADDIRTIAVTLTISDPVITATSGADSGPHTLREALATVARFAGTALAPDHHATAAWTVQILAGTNQVWQTTSFFTDSPANGFSSAFNIQGNVTIDASASPGFMLKAQQSSPPARLFVVQVGSSLTLKNMVAFNARANSNGFFTSIGGLVLNFGTFNADHVTFKAGEANTGSTLYNSGGTVSLTDCTFIENPFLTWPDTQSATVASRNGAITLTRVTFNDGVAPELYVFGDAGLATVNVTDSTVPTFLLTTTNGGTLAIAGLPHATNDSVDYIIGQTLTLDLATLLANDLGTSAASVAVDATTAKGVTLTRTGDTLTYQPPSDVTDSDSFTYTVTDAAGRTSTATVTLTFKLPSSAPLANSDTAAVYRGLSTEIDVLANDSNPVAGALTISAISTPARGTAQLTAGGTRILYTQNDTPANQSASTDTFTYSVTNSFGTTSNVAVTVAINDRIINATSAADAGADTLRAALDVVARFAGDTLAPDHKDSPDWTIRIFAGSGQTWETQTYVDDHFPLDRSAFRIVGNVIIDAAGSPNFTLSASQDVPQNSPSVRNFIVMPGANFELKNLTLVNGVARNFFVGNSSGGAVYNSGTFSATQVTFRNHSANSGAAIYNDGGTTTLTDCTFSDNSVEGGFNSIGGIVTSNGGSLALTRVALAGNGPALYVTGVHATLSVVASTVDSYQLVPLSNGTIVTTGLITAVADDVTGVLNSALSNGGTFALATSTLVANDSAFNGVGLNVTAVSGTTTLGGNVQLDSGTITYTPPSTLGTQADTFTYTVTSNAGATAVGTVTLHVSAPGNHAPVAGADTMVRLRTQAGVIFLDTLLANDSDPDGGDTITFDSVASTSAQGATVSFDQGFDPDFGPFSQVTYHPPADPITTDDTFTYVIRDSQGATATGTVTVKLLNRAPIAGAKSITVRAGDYDSENTDGFYLQGATDADHDPLTVISVSPTSAQGAPVDLTDGVITYAATGGVSGTDTFSYTISDGFGGTSTATVTVRVVNGAPTLNFMSDPAAIPKNASAQIMLLTGITAGGGQSQNLTVTATSSNTALIPNPTVTYTSPNTTGSLSYTPVANATGTALITVTVTDDGGTAGGGLNSDTEAFTVTVTAANTPPTLDPLTNPTAILEDAGLQTVNLTGISAGAGDSAQTVTVTATSSNTALIPNPIVNYHDGDPTGSLTYAPAANANGSAVITVTVTDNGTGTNTATLIFTVNVTPVNDPPTLAAITNPTAILEDAGLQTVNLTGISAGPNESDALTITATSSNTLLIPNPTVHYTSGGSGTLTYTPVANASGSAVITVTVTDNGTGTNSTTQQFTVAVTPVNDAPTLDPITDPVAILEDAGVQTVNLTNISAGPGESDTLTITATSSNVLLIPNPTVHYTALAASGTLTYTPVANANGAAVITVTITDNGGTANSGANTITRQFNVAVTPVNDAPTLDAIASPAALEQGAAQQTINLSGITTGGGDTLQVLTVTAVSDNLGLVANPTVTYTSPQSSGSLSYTPVSGASGTALITVRVQDDGGTLNSGVNFVTRTFTVTVNAADTTPPALTITARTGGGVTLHLIGHASTSYTISLSTDLLNWTSLTTVTTDGSGAASVDDTTAPAEGAARFYRAVKN